MESCNKQELEFQNNKYGRKARRNIRKYLHILQGVNGNPNHRCPVEDARCYSYKKKRHVAKACRSEPKVLEQMETKENVKKIV